MASLLLEALLLPQEVTALQAQPGPKHSNELQQTKRALHRQKNGISSHVLDPLSLRPVLHALFT